MYAALKCKVHFAAEMTAVNIKLCAYMCDVKVEDAMMSCERF